MDFKYTYSAPTENERREIESIKRQYEPKQKEENKLDELRKLDRKVNRAPLILSLGIGIVGTLIMGVGMTMTLEWNLLVWGVIVGIVGIATAAVAYPIYRATIASNKRKYGQKIVELSNELLGKNDKEQSVK